MKKKKSYITVHIYRCMRRSMRDLRTIYVCTYISIYVQAHTRARANTHTYTYTRTRARKHIHAHARANTHTHTRARTDTHKIHTAHVHRHTRTRTRAYVYCDWACTRSKMCTSLQRMMKFFNYLPTCLHALAIGAVAIVSLTNLVRWNFFRQMSCFEIRELFSHRAFTMLSCFSAIDQTTLQSSKFSVFD